jgi:hypothetical protein
LVTFCLEIAFYNRLLKERKKGYRSEGKKKKKKKRKRKGKRCRMLLDDLKERSGYSHLKEETLIRKMWRARFGRVMDLS